jgi:hypothetical protein
MNEPMNRPSMRSHIQIWRVVPALGPTVYALALLFFSSEERVLAAPPMKGGSVIAIDQKTRSFTCHRQTGGEWTCQTTPKTIFMVGNTKGSWADIKKGVVVECIVHHEGQAAVADRVEIERLAAQPNNGPRRVGGQPGTSIQN